MSENEQDRRETLADIVTDLRGRADAWRSLYTPGNAAAMREALVAVKKSIDGIGESSLDCDPTILLAALTQVCARLSARIERALSAPARQCDVGTAEEQSERMEKAVCSKHHGCVRCPLRKAKYSDCSLVWAQTPYAAEEGGAK